MRRVITIAATVWMAIGVGTFGVSTFGASAAEAAPVAGHGVGTVTFTDSADQYSEVLGPFTFEGVVTSGSRVFAGQFYGGYAVQFQGYPFSSLPIRSAVPGALRGSCAPDTVFNTGIVTSPQQNLIAFHLSCLFSIEGAAAAPVSLWVVGRATAARHPGGALEVVQYSGVFAG